MKPWVLCITLLGVFFLSGCKKKQHLTRINPVAYTDVQYIASRDTVLTATLDGRIFLENKGKQKRKLFAQIDDEIYDLAYSKVNGYLFAATFQSGVVVLNAHTGKLITRLKTPYWCPGLALNDDETTLAGACVNGTVFLWDLTHNFERSALSTGSPAFAVQFYHGGSNLAVAGYTVSLWDVGQKTPLKTLNFHRGIIKSIDVRWKNRLLVSSSYDKTATVVDLNDFSLKHRLSHPNFPPTARGREVEIPIHLALTACKIVGTQIITAGADRTLRVWDADTGRLVKTLSGHRASIANVAISPNGKQLASVSLKGELRFWPLD